jgi:hypothetical protein
LSPILLQNQGPSPHPSFILFMLLRELSGFGDELSSCMWLIFMGGLGIIMHCILLLVLLRIWTQFLG